MGFQAPTSAQVTISGTVTTSAAVTSSSQTMWFYNNQNVANGTTSNIYTVATGKTLYIKGIEGYGAGGDYGLQVSGSVKFCLYLGSGCPGTSGDVLAVFTSGQQIDLTGNSAGAHLSIWGVLQ